MEEPEESEEDEEEEEEEDDEAQVSAEEEEVCFLALVLVSTIDRLCRKVAGQSLEKSSCSTSNACTLG